MTPRTAEALHSRNWPPTGTRLGRASRGSARAGHAGGWPPDAQRITALLARSLSGPSRVNGRPYRRLCARLSQAFRVVGRMADPVTASLVGLPAVCLCSLALVANILICRDPRGGLWPVFLRRPNRAVERYPGLHSRSEIPEQANSAPRRLPIEWAAEMQTGSGHPMIPQVSVSQHPKPWRIMKPGRPGPVRWDPSHDHGGFPVLEGCIPNPKSLTSPPVTAAG